MALLILLAFILLASLWYIGQSDWHLNRNKHNKLPKGKLELRADKLYEDEAGLLWELQPHIKNKFHQPDHESDMVEDPYPNLDGTLIFDPKNPNLKLLSKDKTGGSYEAILQPDGTFLIDGPKQGTYNYSHPGGILGSIKHVFLDVIPHFVSDDYDH